MTHIAGLSLYVNARPRTERNHNNKTLRPKPANGFGRHVIYRAATLPACRSTLPLNSVEEVSGTGHIHGDAGLAGRLEHFLITNGPTRLDDGLDTGVDQNLGTVGEPLVRLAPSASVLARSTDRLAESTRLTWPMPMPTVA